MFEINESTRMPTDMVGGRMREGKAYMRILFAKYLQWFSSWSYRTNRYTSKHTYKKSVTIVCCAIAICSENKPLERDEILSNKYCSTQR